MRVWECVCNVQVLYIRAYIDLCCNNKSNDNNNNNNNNVIL